MQDAFEKAKLFSEREHVTPFFYNKKNNYRIGKYNLFKGLKHHRWTLDEPDDYKFLSKFFEYFKDKNIFHTNDILSYLDQNPNFYKLITILLGTKDIKNL